MSPNIINIWLGATMFGIWQHNIFAGIAFACFVSIIDNTSKDWNK